MSRVIAGARGKPRERPQGGSAPRVDASSRQKGKVGWRGGHAPCPAALAPCHTGGAWTLFGFINNFRPPRSEAQVRHWFGSALSGVLGFFLFGLFRYVKNFAKFNVTIMN